MHRKAESTDAQTRGGPLHSSDAAGQCPSGEGGRSPASRSKWVNWQQDELAGFDGGGSLIGWHEPDKLRGLRPVL